jgi:hypothetical protein
MDVFHKRMAKAFAAGLGEAFISGLSIADPRMKKVLFVLFSERRLMEEQRRQKDGAVEIPSPVAGKPPATSTLGGIEHALFDLGLQVVRDLLAEACATVGTDAELAEKLGDALTQHFEKWTLGSIVSDALSSAANSIKKIFPDAQHFVDWWHRRTTLKKEVQKLEGKKKDKKPLYPGFEGASVALGNVFSDCIYAKMSYDEFVGEVNRRLAMAAVNVHKDEAHTAAWEKLMGKAEKMYAQTNIEKGSGVNELFHAHLRFFCLKGDAMSTTHWKILVYFAFLSFNNFPNWQQRVVDAFLKQWD